MFVRFANGSSIFVNSDGKTYVVDIDNGNITEKLPEIPTCEEGDENCTVETGGTMPPAEEGKGESGCDCRVAGQNMSPESLMILLALLARAPRRRK